MSIDAKRAIQNVAFGGHKIGYHMTFAAVSPDGTVTGKWGSLCYDSSGAGVWICTTSGTGWVVISA